MKDRKPAVPSRMLDRAKAMNTLNWSCLGKDGFDTRDAAQRVIQRMLRRRDQKGGGLNAYRCQYCHQWHIESRP